MDSDPCAHDGARLEDVLDRDNTAGEVWGGHGLSLCQERGDLGTMRVRIAHPPQKPKGKTMPERTRIANAQKSEVRSAIEHVFAHKGLLDLTIRTIGLARARVKIGLANFAYNIRRFIWPRTKYLPV